MCFIYLPENEKMEKENRERLMLIKIRYPNIVSHDFLSLNLVNNNKFEKSKFSKKST